MATPIIDLEAVRGTVYSELITLADDGGDPVSTSGAIALFVIRTHSRGAVVLEKDQTDGISFGPSNMTVVLTEEELEAITYNTLYYDLFIQLYGDVKKKISRGTFYIE